MAIPNVKRFRPFCPTCNDSYTLMAVLPQGADVDKYLADAVARHDHKAFNDSKTLHTKVRRSEEHTSELQSLRHLVCRLLLEKKKQTSSQASYAISPCAGCAAASSRPDP